MNPQALEAAIQMLTAAITGLRAEIIAANAPAPGPPPAPAPSPGPPPAPGKPAPSPPPAADGGGRGVGGMFGSLIGRFAMALGPLYVFSQVVGGITSNLGVMGKAMQVFAGTLAPILLPVAVLIATAFTALSDVVLATLMPGLETFFSVVMSLGVPAIVALVSVAQELQGTFESLMKWVERNMPSDDPHGVGAKSTVNWSGAVTIDGFNEAQMGEFRARVDAEKKRMKDAGEAAPSQGALFTHDFDRDVAASRKILDQMRGEGNAPSDERSSTETAVMGALRDVMGSLRNSIGPKAQISGLEGFGKGFQTAAINNDPLEARMLRTQQQIFQLLERVVGRMENARGAFGPGDGDFGGPGAGGGIGGDF